MHRFALCRLLFAALLILPAACDSGGGGSVIPTDADSGSAADGTTGTDGDTPSDSATATPLDSTPNSNVDTQSGADGSCQGAASCFLLTPTKFECETVNEGCTFTENACTGTPYDCQWVSEEKCKDSLICMWSSFSETCSYSGVVNDCEELPRLKDTCLAETGCFWNDAKCEGAQNAPCSASDTEGSCNLRAGCFWISG